MEGGQIIHHDAVQGHFRIISPAIEDESVDVLDLCFNSPGTYTMTGTGRYTKQKVSFKVFVKTPTVAEFNEAVSKENFAKAYRLYDPNKTALGTADDSSMMIRLNGTKKVTDNFRIEAAANAGGKIGVKSDNTSVASADAKGIITAKKAGTAKITVTITPAKKKDSTSTAAAEAKYVC